MGKPEKKTPSAAEKAKDPKSSGKKLVQARLPFKILPSSPYEATKAEQGVLSPSSGAIAVSSPTRKRKLSYSENEETEVKENKSKPVVDPAEVVLLDDSDVDEPKTPVQKSAKGTGSGCKLKIKLPSSKKKRKSKSFQEKKADSDVELVSEENPQKKAKIEDGTQKPASDTDEPSKDTEKEADEKVEESPTTETPTTKSKASPKFKKLSSKIVENALKKLQVEKPENADKASPKSSKKETKKTNTPKSKKEGSASKAKPEVEKTENSEEKEKKASPKSKTPATKKEAKNTPKSRKTEPKSHDKSVSEKEPKEDEPVEEASSDKVESPKNQEDKTKKSDEKSENVGENASKEESMEAETKSEENKEDSESGKDVSEKDEPKPESMEVDDDVVEIIDDAPSKAESTKESKTPAGKRLRSSLDNTSKSTPTNRRSITKDNAKPSTPNSLKKSEQRKQLQKEEREKKLQEEKLQRQKEREEKEAQRKKEKEEKELERKREREEKEEQRKKEKEEKELERKREKEEKEEQRKKEKEEKDELKKKKQAELDAKNEEKRKKDEEDRKKKEEIENKKKKAAEAFTKFFVKPSPAKENTPTAEEPEKEGTDLPSLAFKPFQVRADMNLAPTVRRQLESPDKANLESVIENESDPIDKSKLYLESIRSGKHTPYKESRHIRDDEEEDDCAIIEDDELGGAGEKIEEAKKKWYRAKYFRFIENKRPPFYGTWRKSSNSIGPRTPFGKDIKFFDYEIDSDDEWEEEEPGESLHGSDDEKDKESEDDDYDIDNKWLVPHGHLSDEELGDDDMEDTSREAQKAKLKVLQQEFDQKMKKKTEKLKPRLIGVIWADENGNKPVSCPDVIWESLSKRAMIYSEIPAFEEPKEEVDESEDASISSTPPPQRLEFNDELVKELTRLVHHNNNSKQFIINEFIAFSCKKYEIEDAENLGIRKGKVREKIEEFAEWGAIEEVGTNKKKKKFLCWVINPEHLEKYSLNDLGDRNSWEYILEPKKHNIEKSISTPTPKASEASSSTEDTAKNTKPQQPASGKKRVNILMSVPRGQAIPQQSKNALISNFLQKNKNESSAGAENTDDVQEDDVILLDD